MAKTVKVVLDGIKELPKIEVVREDPNKTKMEQILLKEKPQFQSLGKGINNGIFYFGMKINEDDKFYDAVVTSDHKIYVNWRHSNEIKASFGLNYRFPLYDSVLDSMWSRTGKFGILKWYKNEVPAVTVKEVFEDVLELEKWKVWYPSEIEYKKHALDIIASYFDPLFECHGRIIIYGESGWGKTRQTDVYDLLAFNPSKSLDFSDSGIFRTIESTKATILCDNFDQLEDDKKRRITNLFQGGYSARQKTVRSEKGTIGFRPIGFNIYSHMVVNGLSALNYVSESRANITRMLKSDDPKYAKLEDKNPIWQETMDKLHVCALQNFESIQKVYNELVEKKLVDRELERAIGILTIAKAISKKLYAEMLEYFIKENDRRKKRDFKDEWLYNALEYVIGLFIINQKDGEKEIAISSKMIGEAIGNQLFDPVSKYFDRNVNKFKRTIGKIFSNCPLLESKIKDGYTNYIFNHDNLIKLCSMKNYDDLIDSLNSLNSLTTLKPLNSLSSESSESSEEKHNRNSYDND
jgi:hypothetical protein